jgi:hypothetical protein
MTDRAHTKHEAATRSPVCSRSKWFWARITVSLFFGMLTVALCVLWVRSYWRCDVITHAGQQYRVFNSNSGYMKFTGMPRTVTEQLMGRPITSLGWKFGSHEASPNNVGSRLRYSARGWTLNLPYWAIATVTAGVGAASWHVPRFSLRTLLIATTLVAVVLGLLVWAAR